MTVCRGLAVPYPGNFESSGLSSLSLMNERTVLVLLLLNMLYAN